MRPAWSIIFFTTMSGLGLGLAGWIVIGLLPLMTPASVMGVGIATLALIGVGLISSTFHLGHPERAWRALSQWRSSWLSREGVLAVIVMAGLAGWFAAGYSGTIVPVWANLLLLVQFGYRRAQRRRPWLLLRRFGELDVRCPAAQHQAHRLKLATLA